MGGSNDEATDAPAWLSRAAAQYGGLDALADELGSDEPREHVSERGTDETLEAALDGADTVNDPEAVVADRGVDDVFAEIEAAAPDPATEEATETRSSEDHPLLDAGQRASFDSLADAPDREAVEDDVDDLFDDFTEDDPAEVAAAAESDGSAGTAPDDATPAVADTADREPTGADEETPAAGDIERVPADLFDDLADAIDDPLAAEGADDAVSSEASDDTPEDDVDVFEWVETASSPMTDGDESTDGTEGTDEDPFESLADREDPAPTDVLDDPDDGAVPESEPDTDTPIGAWEYDPERGLHVETGDESTDEERDGTTATAAGSVVDEDERAGITTDDGETLTTDENETLGTGKNEAPRTDEDALAGELGDAPDDGLVGPEYAPDDLTGGASGSDTGERRRDTTTFDDEGSSDDENPNARGDGPGEGAVPDDGRQDETVLDAADMGHRDENGDDRDEPAPMPDSRTGAYSGSEDDQAVGARARADHGGDDRREVGKGDRDAVGPGETDAPDGVDARTRAADPETTAGPDVLDEVAGGPEESATGNGVIGRVRSFIGRLLP